MPRRGDGLRNTDSGAMPLHLAAFFNGPEVAKLLIDNGAEVNAKDEDGATPLHLAAQKNTAAVVKLLIDNGAAVNAKAK